MNDDKPQSDGAVTCGGCADLRARLAAVEKHLADANRGAETNAHALRLSSERNVELMKQVAELKQRLEQAEGDRDLWYESFNRTAVERDALQARCDRLTGAAKWALSIIEINFGESIRGASKAQYELARAALDMP